MQPQTQRVRVASPGVKRWFYPCFMAPSWASHRWSTPLLAYKMERVALGQGEDQEGSIVETTRCLQTETSPQG
jgi:hypothetical protein